VPGGARRPEGASRRAFLKGKSIILGQVAPGGLRESPGEHFQKEN